MSDAPAILLCLPDGAAVADPGPEHTAARGVRLVDTWDDEVIGVAGWSSGGWRAIETAIAHPGLPRLVLAATAFEDGARGRDLSLVAAKTLLLFGTGDPETGSSHGRRWQQALPDARLEMVPGAGHDLLAQTWKRALSHLAPGRRA